MKRQLQQLNHIGKGLTKMAWAFSLSIECGQSQAAAEQVAAYFGVLSLTLSENTLSQCNTTLFQDMDEGWWCRVCPSNVSEIGIEAPEAAYLMTELGILLYQQLRRAPAFRYALVGVEVDEFRTYEELLAEPSTLSFPGLVLSIDTWKAMKSPPTFRSFAEGYVWQLYEGEIYRPLIVSTELKAQLRNLLAA